MVVSRLLRLVQEPADTCSGHTAQVTLQNVCVGNPPPPPPPPGAPHHDACSLFPVCRAAPVDNWNTKLPCGCNSSRKQGRVQRLRCWRSNQLLPRVCPTYLPVYVRRASPADPLDWQPSMADRLSARIAQLAATNATDMSYKSPWAVELAERVPEVSAGEQSAVFRGGGVNDMMWSQPSCAAARCLQQTRIAWRWSWPRRCQRCEV
jgi:hypothetical protein